MTQEFENGHMMVRINHFAKDGDEISLDIEKELLPNTYEMVDLLSPYMHQTRELLSMYLEELIDLLPAVKEEGVANSEVMSVFETLLLALDFSTDTKHFKVDYKQEHREYVAEILSDCFESEKKHSFSHNANRPKLNKGEIMQKGDKIYTMDNREEKTRVYMAVLYEKPENLFERFKQVGRWLAELDLKPNTNRVEYEEYLKGMTNEELHHEFIYDINRVKRTFSWFLNSYSCRENELTGFDEIDLHSKLGIR